MLFIKVPAFETSDGQYIAESNAIAYYGMLIEIFYSKIV